ncbi:endonuclease MutS2 [candidate division KSB1 bacterium]
MNTTRNDSRYSYDSLEWEKIKTHLLSGTVSEPGAQKIKELRPFSDRSQIEYHLGMNFECRQIIIQGVRFPIEGFSGIEPILRALDITAMSLTSEEINSTATNLETAASLKKALDPHSDEFPGIHKLSRMLQPHDKITANIRKKIDENGDILDTASSELKRIRRQISLKQEQLKNRADDLLKQYGQKGFLRESHVTLRNGRYVLPVKDSHIRHVQGITHDISSTGQTSFIEPSEIVERNNEISRLYREEQEEIRRILSEISDTLRSIREDLTSNQAVMTEFDFHYACGRLAYKLEAYKPVITDSPQLIMRQARHPLLLLKDIPAADVIPMDITLGDDYETVIISGPNAGGKTVGLKTIGLLCLMVQCGLPVPAAEDSEFPVFDRITAEIGDPQSIEQDLSTFSARLLNIKKILDDLTGRDLILLDELGAGTDPQEGAALATAIIEYLTKNGALTVATTHHGGLKLFANETERVENASLAFDEKSLKPTYFLTVGIPGSSYALELSERIGLPRTVLKRTKEQLGGQQIKIENLIRDLESRIADLKEKSESAEDQQRKLDLLIKEYDYKLESVQEKYAKKLEDEVGLSEDRVQEFNKKFEQLVKDIREQQASKETISRAKDFVEHEKKRIDTVKKKQKKAHRPKKKQIEEMPDLPVEIGSAVRITGYDQAGTIIAENQRKKSVTVQMASVRMEVSRDQVYAIPMQKDQKISYSARVPDITIKPELDLRGMAADDALEFVDQYLMDALAQGFSDVRIVHGKGTGVLRKVVGEYLKHDTRVAESRLGAWGEGDTGVTVVKLKK